MGSNDQLIAARLDLVTVEHIIIEHVRFPDCSIGPVLGSPVAYSSLSGQRLGLQVGMVTRTPAPSAQLDSGAFLLINQTCGIHPLYQSQNGNA